MPVHGAYAQRPSCASNDDVLKATMHAHMVAHSLLERHGLVGCCRYAWHWLHSFLLLNILTVLDSARQFNNVL